MKSKSKVKKAATEKKITLTVRAHKQDEIKVMNKLLDVTAEKTYTGAVMKAAERYPIALKEITDMRNTNEKLKADLQNVNSIIDRWLNVQNELVNLKVKQKHKPYPTRGE